MKHRVQAAAAIAASAAACWLTGSARGWDCPLDFNHDCFVSGDDFDLFVNAFLAGAPAADYNHDGFVSGDDFDLYTADFIRGCLPADFNGDGTVTCADQDEFLVAFSNEDPRADFDCDGRLTIADTDGFFAAFAFGLVDRKPDQWINCEDWCAFVMQFSTWDMAADYDCDGELTIDDALAYTTDFLKYTSGESCVECH